MKTLYIECNMGVAGDMLMGALYELCDQKEKFLSDMNQAFAPYGVTLSVEPAVKCGISGTHMRVAVHGKEEHSHDVLPEHIHEDGHMTIHAQEESPTHDHGTQCCHEHVHDEDACPHQLHPDLRTDPHTSIPIIGKRLRSRSLPSDRGSRIKSAPLHLRPDPFPRSRID